MSQVLSLTLFAVALSLAAARASAQGGPPPEDQLKLAQRFFAQETKCRGLLRGGQWKEAEAVCKESVRLADRFADHRELEKMRAYASVGHALMGQERYREAATYYARAVEVSRPRLDDSDAEVGDMYLNLGVAHYGLGDLNSAREWYRKAERTYQTAYSGIDAGEVTAEVEEMKRGYLRALRRVFEYHLRAAEDAGAAAEVEEIKRQLAKLP